MLTHPPELALFFQRPLGVCRRLCFRFIGTCHLRLAFLPCWFSLSDQLPFFANWHDLVLCNLDPEMFVPKGSQAPIWYRNVFSSACVLLRYRCDSLEAWTGGRVEWANDRGRQQGQCQLL